VALDFSPPSGNESSPTTVRYLCCREGRAEPRALISLGHRDDEPRRDGRFRAESNETGRNTGRGAVAAARIESNAGLPSGERLA